MNEEFETSEEDLSDPFELLDLFGFHITEQEDEEGDEEDFDEAIYWVNTLIFESALAGWGRFPNGLTWDGAREMVEESVAEEFSCFENFWHVLAHLREERLCSQLP
jgi:hypothetical protein